MSKYGVYLQIKAAQDVLMVLDSLVDDIQEETVYIRRLLKQALRELNELKEDTRDEQ